MLGWDCWEIRKSKVKEDPSFEKNSGNNLAESDGGLKKKPKSFEFLPSDEDSESHGDALYEWDELIDFFDLVWAAGTHGRVSISSINSGRRTHDQRAARTSGV